MKKNFRDRFRPLLHKLHLHGLYTWLRENSTALAALVCKYRYSRHIKHMQQKPCCEKIRVLFIVSEIAKWKEQRVYEALEKSGQFEPIVGLSAWNRQASLSVKELAAVFDRAEKFFAGMGVKTVRTIDLSCGEKVYRNLYDFKPDIVYYTEPWSPCEKQDPRSVSKYAITVYTPYFTPNYGVLSLDCHQFVHRLLYAYFTLNEQWSDAYRKSLRFVAHSTRFVPTGHPTLDYYADGPKIPPRKGSVIYAPHFSFYNPNNPDYSQRYSTFDKNRNEILAYAKQHPEFTWVFKPHPVLREWIRLSGLMTQKEVDDYFMEWSTIGTVCEDGNYQDLFLDSRAIITDCGSFLTEYGSTGRPVIHLINLDNTYEPTFLIRDLYDTYYKVHNLEEMYATFKLVLENGEDPLLAVRIKEAGKVGILQSNATNSILSYLQKLCGRSSGY